MDVNCYGRKKFDREIAQKVVSEFTLKFKKYYLGLGYQEEDPVPISSGVDPTVRFVGSHISVLKPHLVTGGIPQPGIFLVQNCIRTQNLKRLYDDSYFPRWGSFFPSLGTISPPDGLDRVVSEAIGLLTEVFNIDKDLIVARVTKEDKDLFASASKAFEPNKLEIDTMPISYYRHKLGAPELKGRNFNFALKNCDKNEFADVGNAIVLERDGIPVAVELALGSTTIIKQLFGLNHVLDCHTIIGLEGKKQPFGIKLTDCLITSLYLYRENLRPGGTDNRRRILRMYLEGIKYFEKKLNINDKTLEEIIIKSEGLEFGNNKISSNLVSDLNKINN